MKSRHAFRRATALLLLPISTSACYTHRPLAEPVPPPSTRIIAAVTDSGTVRMGDAIGAGAIEVEGVVAEATPSEWKLHLVRVDHRDGTSTPWKRELVSFPRFSLANPVVKRLDRTRSWIAAGVIVGGAFIAARLFNLIGASGEENGGPEPQQLIVPGPRGTRE